MLFKTASGVLAAPRLETEGLLPLSAYSIIWQERSTTVHGNTHRNREGYI